MAEGYAFNDDARRRISDAVRAVEGDPGGGALPGRTGRAVRTMPVDFVKIQSTTTVSGRYDGKVEVYNDATPAWETLHDVWAIEPNGGTLAANRYLARLVGSINGRPLYEVSLGDGGLTVREADGSPSYPNINKVSFGTGFTVTNPATGESQVDYTSSAASPNDFNYFRQVGTSVFEAWYPPSNHILTVGTITWSSAGTAQNGRIYAYPFLAPRGGTIDSLKTKTHSTQSSGTTVRAGVYAANGGGLTGDLSPSTRVVDGGAVTTTAGAQFLTWTLTANLTVGYLYYLVLEAVSGTLQMSEVVSGSGITLSSNLGADSNLSTGRGGVYGDMGSPGALPSSFPTPITLVTNKMAGTMFARLSA